MPLPWMAEGFVLPVLAGRGRVAMSLSALSKPAQLASLFHVSAQIDLSG
jgi:hypothetical protein